MSEFKVRTKGGAPASGKPRVYFTCHPDDFSRYFDKICEDVFKSHDPAIFYTEDMSCPLDGENLDTDLGRMSLVLVPVTYKLLKEDNRAIKVDLTYANQHNIPILPFMMESKIEEAYYLSDNFGEKQYLSPFSIDDTEVSYLDKLKGFLEDVLISDELAARVRAAFDAYVFLSYRKKDRRYANELMRIIHAVPGLRDIAVWYDEFLTPGESFMENIDKAMTRSNLFTLLVTPSLLEEGNFVMRKEYPAAVERGMEILPAEMEKTDLDRLKTSFVGIPEPLKTDDKRFSDRLLSAVKRAAITENDREPEHNFLIGLAYLEGIDVEVDVQRGVELITSAAEAELPEAIKKLYNMYSCGYKVKDDCNETLKWAQLLVDVYTREKGEEDPDTLSALSNLGYSYAGVGDYKKSLEINEKVYSIRCRTLGEEHSDTLRSLNNMGYSYDRLGNFDRAGECYSKSYELQCKSLGSKHPATLVSLNNLAATCNHAGGYNEALLLHQKVYTIRLETLGEEHPHTMASLNNVAYTYIKVGQLENARNAFEEYYALAIKVLGKEHPDTLRTMNNLSYVYGRLKDYFKALVLDEELAELSAKVFGEEHPHTLMSLDNLANTYGFIGNIEKALDAFKKIYALSSRVRGELHTSTISYVSRIAYASMMLGDLPGAMENYRKAYEMRKESQGEAHEETLKALNNLAYTHARIYNYDEAIEAYQELYDIQSRTVGEKSTDALTTLKSIMTIYGKMRRYELIIPLNEKAYEISCELYGREHPDTMVVFNNLAINHYYNGDNKKAYELLSELYELQCRVLGEDHQYTQNTKSNMDSIGDMI